MTEQEDNFGYSFMSQGSESDDNTPDNAGHHNPKHHHKTAAKKKPAVKKLHEHINELEESLKKTVEEKDEYKDKYLRTLAEIDNFRKRVKKEKEEYQKYVLSEFLLDLLLVFDNLERALKAKTPSQKKESVLNLLVSDDEKSIISGVEMIYKQFLELLKKYNVVEIDALNKPFDPNLHQALSKEESDDVSEPTVIEVYQKGFMYNNKLLKPTLAKVAIPREKEAPEPVPETEEIGDEENNEDKSSAE